MYQALCRKEEALAGRGFCKLKATTTQGGKCSCRSEHAGL